MSHSDSPADRQAADAVRGHHAQLAEALYGYAEQLVAAVDRTDRGLAERTRDELLNWLHTELVPHALAEETTMYPAAAARPAGRLLVDGMLDEHRAITGLVEEIETSTMPAGTAAAARALSAVFDTHLAKENDLIVPLLVGADEVSLADLLGGMHALLGAEPAADREPGGCGCGGCGCGGDRSAEPAPLLGVDARPL